VASSHLLRGAGVIVALGVGPLVAHLRPEAARPVAGFADYLWASRRFDPFIHVGLMLVGMVCVGKITALLAGLSLVQVLYARLRMDQLAEIGWRALVPLAMLQMLAAIWI